MWFPPQFVVPPIQEVRADCVYPKLPGMRLPDAVQGVHTAMMDMERRCSTHATRGPSCMRWRAGITTRLGQSTRPASTRRGKQRCAMASSFVDCAKGGAAGSSKMWEKWGGKTLENKYST